MTAVPDFDKLGALDRCDQDAQLLKELVEMFFQEYPNSIAAIRAALQKSKGDELRAAAHSIKGAAGNVGAARAHALAYQLEKLGAQGNIAEASKLLPEFEGAIETFRAVFAKEKL